MSKITIVDIQHKQFKKKLNGYDPADVDQYLDEIIETLEDEASKRSALEAEISDLRERISHFKAMEESLHNTLLLAQRTADEVKASAHKEADLIRHEARISMEREIATYGDRASEARRDQQRAIETAEKAKSELRSLLMTHLSLLDKTGTPAMSEALTEAAAAPRNGTPAIASVEA
jgi:cell division initiation protein